MQEAAGLTILLLLGITALPAQDRVVVGYGEIPPLHYSNDQKQATGFVVDVIREAARREGIAVEWKPVIGSRDVEAGLNEGRIDIFPAGIATPARKAQFDVSEPWWSEDLSLLARADLPDGRSTNWRGARIAIASHAFLELALRIVSGARLDLPSTGVDLGGPDAAMARLCTGQADAVLMAHTEMDQVLSRRPPACSDMAFQVHETNQTLPLAIISRRATGRAARRLRSRIDDLARDGTLAALATRYPRIPARGVLSFAESVRHHNEQRLFWVILSCAIGIVAITTAMLIRQLRIDRTLRRLLAEQDQTDRMLRARTEELTVSNEELQAFAYSVSHDLQEPLRMISLYTQMIQRRCPPDSPIGQSYLRTILSGATRMQSMMDQLLLLSRIGRSEAPRVPVSVERLLSTVLSDLSPAISAASAEIDIGPMPTVEGWPDRLSVVFQNLIANALKYRRDNVPVRISISAVQQDNEWVFSVRDNGIGFDQQYADTIFGVFKRLHVQDKYGGTGVGLAIAKRAVERHGGRIWAEGRLGEGSTFSFTIPVSATHQTRPPELSRPATASEPRRARH